METRAHFIIIGLFTLLGGLGAMAFFIWLASVQIDRQYAQYGVLFDDVSGLDSSGDVLFNGVTVGSVVGVRIWEDDPSLVYVEIEIDAQTPVRTDTVARLSSLGVTGVSYVELSGGSPDALPLIGTTEDLPIISSRRSTFQSLIDDAPDLLADAAELIAQLQQMSGPENQEYVTRILQNLDTASGSLDQALSDFSGISKTISEATAQITTFTDRLDAISATVQSTLETADTTLATINDAVAPAKSAIENIDATFAGLDAFIREDLPPMTEDIDRTLDTMDQALHSADDVFDQAGAIMDTDVGPALTDMRNAANQLGAAMTSIAEDIPVIVSDVGGVVDDIQNAVAAIAPGLRDFGQLGGEARAMVRSINDLVRRIANDPTRFLLDDRVPEYRR